jgi:hypothetical protein
LTGAPPLEEHRSNRRVLLEIPLDGRPCFQKKGIEPQWIFLDPVFAIEISSVVAALTISSFQQKLHDAKAVIISMEIGYGCFDRTTAKSRVVLCKLLHLFLFCQFSSGMPEKFNVVQFSFILLLSTNVVD